MAYNISRMKFGITKLSTCQLFSNFGIQSPHNGNNFPNTSLLIVPTTGESLSSNFRRSFHSSIANFAPQIGNDAAGERRVQAGSIRQRIPKSLSAFAVYFKDNFRSVETTVGRTAEKSPRARHAHVFRSLVDGFKNLPSDERTNYKRKADATKDAHQTALKSLTEEEKQMLKIESRRKKLKRKIMSTQRELTALKKKLDYPAGTGSSSYLAFASEQHQSPGTRVPETAAKIAEAWKNLDQEKRKIYETKAAELRAESRALKEKWRQKILNDESKSIELTKMLNLKSTLRKMRSKLNELKRAESNEEAFRLATQRKTATAAKIKPLLKKKKVIKKKKVVRKKMARKVVKLQTKSPATNKRGSRSVTGKKKTKSSK